MTSPASGPALSPGLAPSVTSPAKVKFWKTKSDILDAIQAEIQTSGKTPDLVCENGNWSILNKRLPSHLESKAAREALISDIAKPRLSAQPKQSISPSGDHARARSVSPTRSQSPIETVISAFAPALPFVAGAVNIATAAASLSGPSSPSTSPSRGRPASPNLLQRRPTQDSLSAGATTSSSSSLSAPLAAESSSSAVLVSSSSATSLPSATSSTSADSAPSVAAASAASASSTPTPPLPSAAKLPAAPLPVNRQLFADDSSAVPTSSSAAAAAQLVTASAINDFAKVLTSAPVTSKPGPGPDSAAALLRAQHFAQAGSADSPLRAGVPQLQAFRPGSTTARDPASASLWPSSVPVAAAAPASPLAVGTASDTTGMTYVPRRSASSTVATAAAVAHRVVTAPTGIGADVLTSTPVASRFELPTALSSPDSSALPSSGFSSLPAPGIGVSPLAVPAAAANGASPDLAPAAAPVSASGAALVAAPVPASVAPAVTSAAAVSSSSPSGVSPSPAPATPSVPASGAALIPTQAAAAAAAAVAGTSVLSSVSAVSPPAIGAPPSAPGSTPPAPKNDGINFGAAFRLVGSTLGLTAAVVAGVMVALGSEIPFVASAIALVGGSAAALIGIAALGIVSLYFIIQSSEEWQRPASTV